MSGPTPTGNGKADPVPHPLPHNIDLEQALLGAILINNEAFHRASDHLEAGDFFDELHQRIYEAAAMLIRPEASEPSATFRPSPSPPRRFASATNTRMAFTNSSRQTSSVCCFRFNSCLWSWSAVSVACPERCWADLCSACWRHSVSIFGAQALTI